MDKESFNRDLEIFKSQILSELDIGLGKMKDSMSKQEISLRNDLHSAIGGFFSYMKDKYGAPNGVVK